MSEQALSVPAVFLDRDGVLNRAIVRDGKPYTPGSLEEFEVLPGVPEAVASLRAAGFKAVVVTNQPDVGHGKQPRALVEAINRRLGEVVAVDAVKVCYHRQTDGCACRKPAPGMLLEAAAELGVDLSRSVLVGDRWGDVEAGKAAGCRATFFIDHGYAETLRSPPDHRVGSLAEAAAIILKLYNAEIAA